MKGLLDTHSFMWWDDDDTKLSAKALAFIQDPNNEILFSVVNAWEMLIKVQAGKLQVRAPLPIIVAEQQAGGLIVLPATVEHVLALESLPLIHKDPFDRILIAQATIEGAVLLTADPIFTQYAVPVLW